MKLRELLEGFMAAKVAYNFGKHEGYSTKNFKILVKAGVEDIHYSDFMVKAHEVWKTFNYEEAEKIVNKLGDKEVKEYWNKYGPKGVKKVKEMTNKIQSKAKKLPKKKFKL